MLSLPPLFRPLALSCARGARHVAAARALVRRRGTILNGLVTSGAPPASRAQSWALPGSRGRPAQTLSQTPRKAALGCERELEA
ncbi:hypothetical protein NDU88_003118 [Pleurodeles waltl]|uniref:Uncharacterized protein n=1 Tax=Pleurodeles waltl TaxID=8319 RepID=A0AAV7UXJ5_PLEWA|nr:hypothetical protein NDU88_003118 [Pleurodeles waltl]